MALSDELTTCLPNEALTVSTPHTCLPPELSMVNCSSRASRRATWFSAESTGVWIWNPAAPLPATLAVAWICALG